MLVFVNKSVVGIIASYPGVQDSIQPQKFNNRSIVFTAPNSPVKFFGVIILNFLHLASSKYRSLRFLADTP